MTWRAVFKLSLIWVVMVGGCVVFANNDEIASRALPISYGQDDASRVGPEITERTASYCPWWTPVFCQQRCPRCGGFHQPSQVPRQGQYWEAPPAGSTAPAGVSPAPVNPPSPPTYREEPTQPQPFVRPVVPSTPAGNTEPRPIIPEEPAEETESSPPEETPDEESSPDELSRAELNFVNLTAVIRAYINQAHEKTRELIAQGRAEDAAALKSQLEQFQINLTTLVGTNTPARAQTLPTSPPTSAETARPRLVRIPWLGWIFDMAQLAYLGTGLLTGGSTVGIVWAIKAGLAARRLVKSVHEARVAAMASAPATTAAEPAQTSSAANNAAEAAVRRVNVAHSPQVVYVTDAIFQEAFEWACVEYVKKYPGGNDGLKLLTSLMNQFLQSHDPKKKVKSP